MWFAAVDGLVLGVLVAVAVLAPWRRTGIGSAVTLVVGVAGGLVGGLLAFVLVAGSTASGPWQPAAIVGGAVGALVTLSVLRSWVVGDRRRVAAAAAADRTARTAEEKQSRRAVREAAAGPSAATRLVVAVLVALRWSRA